MCGLKTRLAFCMRCLHICLEPENKVLLWVFVLVLFSFVLLKENNDTDKETSLSEREKQWLKWKEAACISVLG